MAAEIRREYPQQPLVGVGAIIVADGCVLLIKRGKQPLLGEWSIPGGMLELGETLRRAAEREAHEETGLAVRATELLGVFERIVPERSSSGDTQRTQYHYVLVDFLCERVAGEIRAGADAADAKWFTPEELRSLTLPEDTRNVLLLAFTKCGKR